MAANSMANRAISDMLSPASCTLKGRSSSLRALVRDSRRTARYDRRGSVLVVEAAKRGDKGTVRIKAKGKTVAKVGTKRVARQPTQQARKKGIAAKGLDDFKATRLPPVILAAGAIPLFGFVGLIASSVVNDLEGTVIEEPETVVPAPIQKTPAPAPLVVAPPTVDVTPPPPPAPVTPPPTPAPVTPPPPPAPVTPPPPPTPVTPPPPPTPVTPTPPPPPAPVIPQPSAPVTPTLTPVAPAPTAATTPEVSATASEEEEGSSPTALLLGGVVILAAAAIASGGNKTEENGTASPAATPTASADTPKVYPASSSEAELEARIADRQAWITKHRKSS